MMDCVLGVDVGGTKAAVAPVDRAGAMLAHKLTEPSETQSADAFIAGLERTLRRALEEFECFSPRGIGVACAGTVDVERGVVVKSPNLPLVETAVAGPLTQALDTRVTLANDAKAAIWAESAAGAASGYEHAVLLILGTGGGGGLLLDGRIYRGAHNAAGELGHLVVKPGGLPCGCGGRGHLEPYASGPALERYAAERAGDPESDPDGALADLLEHGGLTGRAVSELAARGHAGALGAVRELAGWVGVALVSITDAFDPQMIVLGGGVSGLGDLLLRPAEEYLRENAIAPGRDEVKVVLAKFGNDAGIIGAGLAAWEALDRAGA